MGDQGPRRVWYKSKLYCKNQSQIVQNLIKVKPPLLTINGNHDKRRKTLFVTVSEIPSHIQSCQTLRVSFEIVDVEVYTSGGGAHQRFCSSSCLKFSSSTFTVAPFEQAITGLCSSLFWIVGTMLTELRGGLPNLGNTYW